MSSNQPQIIEESNMSHAWGRVLLHVLDNSKQNLAPLMVSITGFADGLPIEDIAIRQALDTILPTKEKKYSSKVTALTIFPHDAWVRHGKLPVREFSNWYLEHFFPRMQARDSHNNRGTYFERMVRFQGSKKGKDGAIGLQQTNQLDHIATIWKRDRAKGASPRHSALQASIFDPAKDHTGGKMLGFPCLQQVSFSYDNNDQLAVNAYYPTQYIMDRAYGNYLGLCHLGQFMAQDMGLKMVRLNCFIGLPEIGTKWTKAELKPLAALVRAHLPNPDVT
jgi:thymidylate synthase